MEECEVDLHNILTKMTLRATRNHNDLVLMSTIMGFQFLAHPDVNWMVKKSSQAIPLMTTHRVHTTNSHVLMPRVHLQPDDVPFMTYADPDEPEREGQAVCAINFDQFSITPDSACAEELAGMPMALVKASGDREFSPKPSYFFTEARYLRRTVVAAAAPVGETPRSREKDVLDQLVIDAMDECALAAEKDAPIHERRVD